MFLNNGVPQQVLTRSLFLSTSSLKALAIVVVIVYPLSVVRLIQPCLDVRGFGCCFPSESVARELERL